MPLEELEPSNFKEKKEIDLDQHERNCAKRKLSDVEFRRYLIESGISNILNDPNGLLVIVDLQHDFISGSLAVPGAYDTIDLISRLRKEFGPERVIITEDDHPEDSITFAGEGKPLYGNFEAKGENDAGEMVKATLTSWPPHCRQRTLGQKSVGELGDIDPKIHNVVFKGRKKNIECYSGVKDVFGMSQRFETGPHAGKTVAEVCAGKNVLVTGLAQDFCVGNTARDIKKYAPNSTVHVAKNATAAVRIPLNDGKHATTEELMYSELKEAGVKIIEKIPLKFTTTEELQTRRRGLFN